MFSARLVAAAMLVGLVGCAGSAKATVVQVYKTATCGCCASWVEHLRSSGFDVRVTDLDDTTPVADQLGVPADMRSCHTAMVDGYFVEGHVPSADIRKLLEDAPKASGIAVPGMPMGSPGMDQGGQSEPYDSMLVDRQGAARSFVSHPASRS